MKIPVRFQCEDVSFRLRDQQHLKAWILQTLKKEKKKLKEVNFVFCRDEYLHHLNKEYLHHSTYTDIITFDYSDKISGISGEIFISLDRVKENALKFGQHFSAELHRVMIHGVLHLAGYKDKSAGQKTKMRQKENTCLAALNSRRKRA